MPLYQTYFITFSIYSSFLSFEVFMLILNVYLFQQEKYRKTQQLLRDILSVKFSAVFKSKSEVVLIFKEVPLIFILEIEVKQMSHLEVTNSTAAGSVISN